MLHKIKQLFLSLLSILLVVYVLFLCHEENLPGNFCIVYGLVVRPKSQDMGQNSHGIWRTISNFRTKLGTHPFCRKQRYGFWADLRRRLG